MKETHHIKLNKIILEVDKREESEFIYSELSDLYHSKIQEIIEEVFEKFYIPNTTIKIDRLELSLGVLSKENFKSGFSNQLKNSLTKWFEKNLTDLNILPKENLRSKLEILKSYLTSGTLPWWASGTTPGNFESFFEDLIKSSPDQVRSFLIEYLNIPTVGHRIEAQYSIGLLQNINKLLWQDQLSKAKEVFDQFKAEFSTKLDISKLNNETLNKIYQQTIFQFFQARNLSQPYKNELHSQLISKFQSIQSFKKEKKGETTLESENSREILSLIEYFLKNGSLPFINGKFPLRQLEQELILRLTKNDPELIKLLHRLNNQNEIHIDSLLYLKDKSSFPELENFITNSWPKLFNKNSEELSPEEKAFAMIKRYLAVNDIKEADKSDHAKFFHTALQTLLYSEDSQWKSELFQLLQNRSIRNKFGWLVDIDQFEETGSLIFDSKWETSIDQVKTLNFWYRKKEIALFSSMYLERLALKILFDQLIQSQESVLNKPSFLNSYFANLKQASGRNYKTIIKPWIAILKNSDSDHIAIKTWKASFGTLTDIVIPNNPELDISNDIYEFTRLYLLQGVTPYSLFINSITEFENRLKERVEAKDPRFSKLLKQLEEENLIAPATLKKINPTLLAGLREISKELISEKEAESNQQLKKVKHFFTKGDSSLENIGSAILNIERTWSSLLALNNKKINLEILNILKKPEARHKLISTFRIEIIRNSLSILFGSGVQEYLRFHDSIKIFIRQTDTYTISVDFVSRVSLKIILEELLKLNRSKTSLNKLGFRLFINIAKYDPRSINELIIHWQTALSKTTEMEVPKFYWQELQSKAITSSRINFKAEFETSEVTEILRYFLLTGHIIDNSVIQTFEQLIEMSKIAIRNNKPGVIPTLNEILTFHHVRIRIVKHFQPSLIWHLIVLLSGKEKKLIEKKFQKFKKRISKDQKLTPSIIEQQVQLELLKHIGASTDILKMKFWDTNDLLGTKQQLDSIDPNNKEKETKSKQQPGSFNPNNEENGTDPNQQQNLITPKGSTPVSDSFQHPGEDIDTTLLIYEDLRLFLNSGISKESGSGFTPNKTDQLVSSLLSTGKKETILFFQTIEKKNPTFLRLSEYLKKETIELLLAIYSIRTSRVTYQLLQDFQDFAISSELKKIGVSIKFQEIAFLFIKQALNPGPYNSSFPNRVLFEDFFNITRIQSKLELKSFLTETLPQIRQGNFSPAFINGLEQLSSKLPKQDTEEVQKDISKTWENYLNQFNHQRIGQHALDVLSYYLRHLELPWWTNQETSLEKVINNLLKLNGSEVGKFIHSLPKQQKSLLTDQLHPKSLNLILQKIYGGYNGFILFLSELLNGLTNLKFLKNKQEQHLKWRIPIYYFDRNKAFSTSNYLRTYIDTIKKESGVIESLLIEQIYALLELKIDQNDLRAYSVKSILDEAFEPVSGKLKTTSSDEKIIPTDELASPISYSKKIKLEISQVQHYLQYGSLVGLLINMSKSDLESIQLKLLSKHPKLMQEMYQALFPRSDIRARVLLFSKDLWNRIIFLFFQNKQTIIFDIWEDLRLINYGLSNKSLFDHSFRIIGSGLSGTNFDEVEFAYSCISWAAYKSNLSPDTILHTLVNQKKENKLNQHIDWESWAEKIYEKHKVSPKNNKFEDMDSNFESPSDGTFFIHNSGLVILAPYFQRYFSMLDLLDGKTFKDEASAQRATHLLQYLVTGITDTPEHLLVFNKILCGLPIETPVPASIEPSQSEIDISKQMLTAIIQNWTINKNSTIENLQGSFLIREGKLDAGETNWTLTVEEKAFDILLDHLPWSISIVSLSWMEKRISVKWRN